MGLRHGGGIETYRNGAIYEGQFKNNQRDGMGTMKFVCGDSYCGDWKADKRHGNGVYKFSTEESNANGDLDVGKLNTRNAKLYCRGGRYEGQWVDGKREGEGTMTYADGSVYCGKWIDDNISTTVEDTPNNIDEAHACIVCQEHHKTVLLMPCKHLW